MRPVSLLTFSVGIVLGSSCTASAPPPPNRQLVVAGREDTCRALGSREWGLLSVRRDGQAQDAVRVVGDGADARLQCEGFDCYVGYRCPSLTVRCDFDEDVHFESSLNCEGELGERRDGGLMSFRTRHATYHVIYDCSQEATRRFTEPGVHDLE